MWSPVLHGVWRCRVEEQRHTTFDARNKTAKKKKKFAFPFLNSVYCYILLIYLPVHCICRSVCLCPNTTLCGPLGVTYQESRMYLCRLILFHPILSVLVCLCLCLYLSVCLSVCLCLCNTFVVIYICSTVESYGHIMRRLGHTHASSVYNFSMIILTFFFFVGTDLVLSLSCPQMLPF